MTYQSSYILSHEEQEAKDLIREKLGFEPPRMEGRRMTVKVYVRDEDICIGKDINGKEIKIYVPDVIGVMDRFRSCAALILYKGKDCTKNDFYKVGDWICIPRNEGTQISYRDVTIQEIEEDKVYCVLEDPTHVYKLEGS